MSRSPVTTQTQTHHTHTHTHTHTRTRTNPHSLSPNLAHSRDRRWRRVCGCGRRTPSARSCSSHCPVRSRFDVGRGGRAVMLDDDLLQLACILIKNCSTTKRTQTDEVRARSLRVARRFDQVCRSINVSKFRSTYFIVVCFFDFYCVRSILNRDQGSLAYLRRR
jgi:hypothetical protein